jgi:hypothetical protein
MVKYKYLNTYIQPIGEVKLGICTAPEDFSCVYEYIERAFQLKTFGLRSFYYGLAEFSTRFLTFSLVFPSKEDAALFEKLFYQKFNNSVPLYNYRGIRREGF